MAMVSSDRFSMMELIGEGGMGQVFKVFDNRLGKTCALKICKHSRNEAELQEAIRESAIWFNFRQFGHVVEVYEILKWAFPLRSCYKTFIMSRAGFSALFYHPLK